MFSFLRHENKEGQERLTLIYKKYCKKIHYWAMNYVHDSFIAEDITHNVFLNITKNGNMERINGMDEQNMEYFLKRITKNLAINEYRKTRKENSVVQLKDPEESLYMGTTDQELERLLDNMHLSEIMRSVRKISERYADVLILKYVDEYDDKEISEILDISVTNVRKRVQRGKAQIRKYCEKEKWPDV